MTEISNEEGLAEILESSNNKILPRKTIRFCVQNFQLRGVGELRRDGASELIPVEVPERATINEQTAIENENN